VEIEGKRSFTTLVLVYRSDASRKDSAPNNITTKHPSIHGDRFFMVEPAYRSFTGQSTPNFSLDAPIGSHARHSDSGREHRTLESASNEPPSRRMGQTG
jgi:hypothetical protein